MIKILVADDHALFRAGLVALLATTPDFEVVGEASDGLEAVAIAAGTRPDVVLMDVRMPALDGIEATTRILSASSEAPKVIALTAFDLDDYVYRALAAGASGYLLKQTKPENQIASVRAVAEGENPVAAPVMHRHIELYKDLHRSSVTGVTSLDGLEALTAREADVLRRIAGGLTNDEIAAGLSLSVSTVRTHVRRILAKLGLHSRAQAVVAAFDSGLVQSAAKPRLSGSSEGFSHVRGGQKQSTR